MKLEQIKAAFGNGKDPIVVVSESGREYMLQADQWMASPDGSTMAVWTQGAFAILDVSRLTGILNPAMR
jgi:hypothetical protein